MLLETGLIAMGVYTIVFQLPQLISQAQLGQASLKDPYAASQKIQAELQKARPGRHRETLKLLLAECFFLQGDFPLALHYARSVDRKTFDTLLGMKSPVSQLVYYNGMLYYMVLGGAFREAEELLPEFRRRLPTAGSNPTLYAACWDTLCTYQYYFGELEGARRSFEKSLAGRLSRSKQGRAMSTYFLGRLDLSEAQVDAGLSKVALSAEILPRSFLAEEVQRLADGRERIPPPGEAIRRLKNDT